MRVVAADDTACRTSADCLVLFDCPPISSHFEISSALRFIFPFSVNLRCVCNADLFHSLEGCVRLLATRVQLICVSMLAATCPCGYFGSVECFSGKP